MVFPKCVVTIETQAFSGCGNLKRVVLNEGLEAIRRTTCALLFQGGVFQDSGIEEIVFPRTLTDIGFVEFYGCDHLKTVYVDERSKLVISESDVFSPAKICPLPESLAWEFRE